MKPGDHPEFFHVAPPPGTSRESTIKLDREGRFWHEGQRVENEKLEHAMRTWIAKHPDDGRPILTNGYDWCYFTAEVAPMFVDAIKVGDGAVVLMFFDGTDEELDPSTMRLGEGGVVHVTSKKRKLDARFSRHAQTQLAALLEDERTIVVGGKHYKIR